MLRVDISQTIKTQDWLLGECGKIIVCANCSEIFSAERKFLMCNVSEIKLGLSSWTKYTHNLTIVNAKMEL